MGEVDNVAPFRPDDGRGNTENGTVHFERPSGAKFLGLGRMGNCPPVSGEIGLRPVVMAMLSGIATEKAT